MLNIIDHLPDGFLNAAPDKLFELLGGPTLIHLAGRHSDTLFVSVLLHGNEPVGLLAVQNLLRRYSGRGLPRNLSIFVGNVAAAAEGRRRLDGQLDFNRVWQGGDKAEHRMAQQVKQEMARRELFVSVDIHNNTGLNPHYACINRLDNAFLQLATMFGRTVVYFTSPATVQSNAFAELCPAVTLECGQPGRKYGVEHAAEFLDGCLNLAAVPQHTVAPHDIDLFHTVAVVKVPEGTDFGFDAGRAMSFIPEIDHYNFSEKEAGTLFGRIGDGGARFDCRGENGEDLGERFFCYRNNEIRLARPVMPSMLTLDERVISQDCFCYLMERFEVADGVVKKAPDGGRAQ